ncbi:MAG: adenylate kinase [candidate division WS2 bacterium]|uniref:Adenylate kinase n=1 Tax=Psychracetigena formicireducens TaxID=2986056 RepID=A0A9E2BFJ4_PSYF1|nr:adenylate kinase [Candidatus Psychracetigena formicireducens]MBT9144676.1 adenylate kinase [Candidatus Psychracetigena formicireducens]MBT9150202.1 adenylate kinase [Candidatus Psychracetigena formicireducens]
MIFLLIGPPGSGKGTQGRILSEKMQLPFFSSGDFLRELAGKEDSFSRQIRLFMDRGELIPDTLMKELFLLEIKKLIVTHGGIIIDGYPRTLDQAKDLESLLLSLNISDSNIYVIELIVEVNELYKRLNERAFCPSCLRVFQFHENICNTCGTQLNRRTDDTMQVIEERLREYELKSRSLHEYFSNRGFLMTIPGEGSIQDIASTIDQAIKEKKVGINKK